MVRQIFPPKVSQSNHYARLRIITLNCAGGNVNVAGEVGKYHPDIVLFQESPDEDSLHIIAKRLFGKHSCVAWGADASIISRGQLIPVKLSSDASSLSTYAFIHIKSGVTVRVISLRLLPASFRTDLLSRNFWAQQASDRICRKDQLKLIRNLIADEDSAPAIVGGDFNSPGSDGTTRVLKPLLQDSFSEAGRGWGNTILNDIPLQRIDQIWISRDIRAASCVARKSAHSDHRMVVCDLLVPKHRSNSDASPATRQ